MAAGGAVYGGCIAEIHRVGHPRCGAQDGGDQVRQLWRQELFGTRGQLGQRPPAPPQNAVLGMRGGQVAGRFAARGACDEYVLELADRNVSAPIVVSPREQQRPGFEIGPAGFLAQLPARARFGRLPGVQATAGRGPVRPDLSSSYRKRKTAPSGAMTRMRAAWRGVRIAENVTEGLWRDVGTAFVRRLGLRAAVGERPAVGRGLSSVGGLS